MTQTGWKRAMEKTAVGIAFPTWSWENDDKVKIEVDGGSERTHYSGYTFDEGSVGYIEVDVRRGDHECETRGELCDFSAHSSIRYSSESVVGFWQQLMTGGSDQAAAWNYKHS